MEWRMLRHAAIEGIVALPCQRKVELRAKQDGAASKAL